MDHHIPHASHLSPFDMWGCLSNFVWNVFAASPITNMFLMTASDIKSLSRKSS